MPLELSCAIATSPESPEHARIAESLFRYPVKVDVK
jgi:hypothetical protein